MPLKGIGAKLAKDGRILLWVGGETWHITHQEAAMLRARLLSALLAKEGVKCTGSESVSSGEKSHTRRNTNCPSKMKRRPGHGPKNKRKS